MNPPPVRAAVARISLQGLALIVVLNAWLAGLTGCTADRYHQTADPRIEDSRTAQRVREALAAGADYKYDGVKVMVSNGVVKLDGSVKTSAQGSRAGLVARKVEGVQSVENHLAVIE